MKAFILLAVTLVALLAYGATQESGEEWTVSVEEDTVGPESPLLDGNIEDLPNGGDSKADYQDGVGENAGGDASSRIRRAITGDISPVCGKVYKFNRAQKLAAVRTHNKMRRREGASDMIRLVWSSKMARRAHQWASQCMWKHGMLKDCDGKLVGQNLYMTKNGRYYPPVNVTRVIANGWWSEKKFYNYTTTKCKKNQMCGHYTQVVWGASYEVGCSIVQCPLVTVGVKTPWKKATIFACDYAPTGNYLGVRPYKKGKPCTRCSSVVRHGYYCSGNLCRECNPVTNKRCKCVTRKCDRGTFSKSLCKCVCEKGYWGLTCKERCVCKDVYHNCVLMKSGCYSRSWYHWLYKYCPATCPNVCPKPTKGACP